MEQSNVATPGEQAPEFPGMLPVPVIIGEAISVKERPPRSWSTLQLPVPTFPEVTRIAPKHIARAELTVRNNGGVTIYLGPDQSTTTPSTGFPLPAGEETSLAHTEDVWATAEAAAAASAATGGWKTIIARRTATGGSGDFTSTPKLNIADFDRMLLAFRVYSVTGTAPTSNNVFAYVSTPTGDALDTATLSKGGTAGTARTTINPLMGELFHVYHAWGGGDATTSFDYDVLAYVEPTAPAGSAAAPAAVSLLAQYRDG